MMKQTIEDRRQTTDKSSKPIVNDAAAIAELSRMSRDAKLWLMDRIGNRLHAITLSNSMGRTATVQESADGLIGDMQKIGLFEMQMLRREEEA